MIEVKCNAVPSLSQLGTGPSHREFLNNGIVKIIRAFQSISSVKTNIIKCISPYRNKT